MTYKSKQSKKTALFSKFLQVFKSRATGVAGFHDTLHYHDSKHSVNHVANFVN